MARRPDHIASQGTQRLRGRRGVEQRKRRLDAEPLCRDCYAKGIITASTVPDHIVPLSQGGTDDDSNIQCLCDECHDTKTRQDFGHRERSEVDATGWPTDPGHPWNLTG